jgi:S-adenosyl-L-methionine hydrolase (adenosine-forming)
MAASPLPISFLSDYGHEDEFVGICHGVIQRIAPGAVVIDVVHGLPRHGVRAGAVVLRNALPFLPEGVVLAIVDPGVGSERRAVAARACDGRLLVGPDNGLLWPALERCGGVDEVVDIGESPYRLEPVSATFQGRDLFAPIAARLALGTSLENVGWNLREQELIRLELPKAQAADGRVDAHVLYVDRFGNAQLDLDRTVLAAAGFEHGDTLLVESDNARQEAVYGRTFADVPDGALVAYEDSYECIALAANRAAAAAKLGLRDGSPVTIRRP